MDKKVTIHDIAREAGVSAATVSYIINNRPDKSISEETRQNVLQVINLYNYKPGSFAKNLRAAPNFKLISVYTGNYGDPLYSGEFGFFVEKLHEVFPYNKYGFVLSGLPYRQLENVDAIIAYNIDRESFLQIGKLNYAPLISVDCIVKDNLFFQITTDYKKLKVQAEEYFNDSFTFVGLVPADDSIKEKIYSVFEKVIFVKNMCGLRSIGNSANILTDSRVIAEYLSETNTNVFFTDTLLSKKCKQLLSCLDKALRQVPFAVHNYEI